MDLGDLLGSLGPGGPFVFEGPLTWGTIGSFGLGGPLGVPRGPFGILGAGEPFGISLTWVTFVIPRTWGTIGGPWNFFGVSGTFYLKNPVTWGPLDFLSSPDPGDFLVP